MVAGMNLTSRRLRIAGLATVAAAGLSAIGAVAYASIPDADGTFHACVSKGTSVLRVIDKADSSPVNRCFASETEVHWNQTGAQGVPGAPGAKGDKGDPGAKGDPGGVIDAYADGGGAFGEVPIPDDSLPHVVASKQVPAGNYAVYATGTAKNFDAAEFYCDTLVVGEDVIAEADVNVQGRTTGSFVRAQVAMVGHASLAAPGTIQFVCTVLSGRTHSMDTGIADPSLVILPVGAIH